MGPLDRIIVGIDGSRSSLAALDWADDHARAVRERAGDEVDEELGSVIAVHVCPDDRTSCADVDRLLSRSERGIVAGHHPCGDGPAAGLVARADREAAVAIVVGPHGTGRHRVLGSATRHLLHQADRPVVVVDGVVDLGSKAPVVVAVGYGDPATTAAHWAAAVAELGQRPLHLLHVISLRPLFPVESPVDMWASYLGPDLSTSWAKLELDALAEELTNAHPGLDITVTVGHGSAVPRILAAGESADLVVVGKRRGEPFPLHSISPRLAKVVARSAFPVAIIPS